MGKEVPCPRSALHTPSPEGYLQWHAWAALMGSRGFKQLRCPGCRLYKLWRGSGQTVPLDAFDALCLNAIVDIGRRGSRIGR
jgi:hypothetical protein